MRYQNKETFRRGREGFFLFRGLSWSQAQNVNEVLFLYEITLNRTSLVGATGPARKKKSYFFFFVVFFVVFLDDFLADFLAMRVTSFQQLNVKIVKMYVNVFSKLAQKFSWADFSLDARFDS